MHPTRTQHTANTNISGNYLRTLTVKDPTTPHRIPSTSPRLDEAHTVGEAVEEVLIAEDSTTDEEEEEDGSDYYSRQ